MHDCVSYVSVCVCVVQVNNRDQDDLDPLVKYLLTEISNLFFVFSCTFKQAPLKNLCQIK